MDLSTFIVSVFCLVDDQLKGRCIRSRGPAPLNTSCRHRYKGSATALLRNMFSSLAMERGPKRCGHIKEAERRQRNRRHVPQNALVFGGAREHRVFPGRSGNLVQHRPNPPNRRTVS